MPRLELPMTASHGSGPPVAVLVQDLYFLSSIGVTAAKLGVEVAIVKPGEPIPATSSLIILDLQYPGDWVRVIREIAGENREIVAFGPHVDGSLMKHARAAGCTRVMAKSKFVVELPKLLAQAAHPRSPATAPDVPTV